MPLRLMALFPLVAAASVAMAATELTSRQRPWLARPILMLGLGAALVGFSPRVPGEVPGEASRGPADPVLPT